MPTKRKPTAKKSTAKKRSTAKRSTPTQQLIDLVESIATDCVEMSTVVMLLREINDNLDDLIRAVDDLANQLSERE